MYFLKLKKKGKKKANSLFKLQVKSFKLGTFVTLKVILSVYFHGNATDTSEKIIHI